MASSNTSIRLNNNNFVPLNSPINFYLSSILQCACKGLEEDCKTPNSAAKDGDKLQVSASRVSFISTTLRLFLCKREIKTFGIECRYKNMHIRTQQISEEIRA